MHSDWFFTCTRLHFSFKSLPTFFIGRRQPAIIRWAFIIFSRHCRSIIRCYILIFIINRCSIYRALYKTLLLQFSLNLGNFTSEFVLFKYIINILLYIDLFLSKKKIQQIDFLLIFHYLLFNLLWLWIVIMVTRYDINQQFTIFQKNLHWNGRSSWEVEQSRIIFTDIYLGFKQVLGPISGVTEGVRWVR